MASQDIAASPSVPPQSINKEGVVNRSYLHDEEDEDREGPPPLRHPAENDLSKDSPQSETKLGTFTGNGKILNCEIAIPEDALINYNSGKVRARRKSEVRFSDEKIPLNNLNSPSDKQQQQNGGIPVTKSLDKLHTNGEAKAVCAEYFIPVNNHKKFLRSGKLYITKEGRQPCLRWRVLLCTLAVLTVLGAVLVGVLAASGNLPLLTRAFSSSSHPNSLAPKEGGQPPPPSSPHVQPLPTNSSVPLLKSAFVPNTLEGKLVLPGEKFVNSLLNPDSPRFIALSRGLEKEIEIIFHKSGKRIKSIKVFNFRPGSILVQFVAAWVGAIRPIEATTIVKVHLANSNQRIGKYEVDPSSIKFWEVLDQCQVNNGGCSHTCSWSVWDLKVVCSCPPKLKLVDSRFCVTEDETVQSSQATPDSSSPSRRKEGRNQNLDGESDFTTPMSTPSKSQVSTTDLTFTSPISTTTSGIILSIEPDNLLPATNFSDNASDKVPLDKPDLTTLTTRPSGQHTSISTLFDPTTLVTEENDVPNDVTSRLDIFETTKLFKDKTEDTSIPLTNSVTIESTTSQSYQATSSPHFESTLKILTEKIQDEISGVTSSSDLDSSVSNTTEDSTDVTTAERATLRQEKSITEEVKQTISFTSTSALTSETEASISNDETSTYDPADTTYLPDMTPMLHASTFSSESIITNKLDLVNDTVPTEDLETTQATTESIQTIVDGITTTLDQEATKKSSEIGTANISEKASFNSTLPSSSSELLDSQEKVLSKETPLLEIETTNVPHTTDFPDKTFSVSLETKATFSTQEALESSTLDDNLDDPGELALPTEATFSKYATIPPENKTSDEERLVSLSVSNTTFELYPELEGMPNTTDYQHDLVSSTTLQNSAKEGDEQIDTTIDVMEHLETTTDPHEMITSTPHYQILEPPKEPEATTIESQISSLQPSSLETSGDVAGITQPQTILLSMSPEPTEPGTFLEDLNVTASLETSNEVTKPTENFTKNEGEFITITTESSTESQEEFSDSPSTIAFSVDLVSDYNITLVNDSFEAFQNNKTTIDADLESNETQISNTTLRTLPLHDIPSEVEEITSSIKDETTEKATFSSLEEQQKNSTGKAEGDLVSDLANDYSMDNSTFLDRTLLNVNDELSEANDTSEDSVASLEVHEDLNSNISQSELVAFNNSLGTRALDLDGVKPSEGECLPDEVQCANETKCIPANYICDGIQDCPSGFDELDCEDCSPNFMCSNTSCIPSELHCDGIWDCEEGVDEENCRPEECGASEVKCSDGSRCIKPVDICDNSYNCQDRSDELGCVEKSTCQADGKFYCPEGLCISWSLRCDGLPDCKEGEDELNCTCDVSEFRCMNSTCIPKELQCDGVDDCGDGSDEISCAQVDKNDVVSLWDPLVSRWRPLCGKGWSLEEGHRLCRYLGYSGAKSINLLWLHNEGPEEGSWMVRDPSDNRTEGGLWTSGLVRNGTCDLTVAAGVQCETFECGLPMDYLLRRKRIVNGQPTLLGQWSTIVVIRNEMTDTLCHGVIISPLWLLTSAECLLKQPHDSASSWSAETNLLRGGAGGPERRAVERVVVHPHASRFRSSQVRDYDVALVRLKEPLVLDPHTAAAICLPEEEVQPGITCFTGSFGSQNPRVPPAEPLVLSHLALQVMDREACGQPERLNQVLSGRMLCTTPSSSHLCSNDEGAPLMCLDFNGKKWSLAGLLSYQRFCGAYKAQPSVFSNIFQLKEFIRQTTGLRNYAVDPDPTAYSRFEAAAVDIFNNTQNLFPVANATEEDESEAPSSPATTTTSQSALTEENYTTSYATPIPEIGELENTTVIDPSLTTWALYNETTIPPNISLIEYQAPPELYKEEDNVTFDKMFLTSEESLLNSSSPTTLSGDATFSISLEPSEESNETLLPTSEPLTTEIPISTTPESSAINDSTAPQPMQFQKMQTLDQKNISEGIGTTTDPSIYLETGTTLTSLDSANMSTTIAPAPITEVRETTIEGFVPLSETTTLGTNEIGFQIASLPTMEYLDLVKETTTTIPSDGPSCTDEKFFCLRSNICILRRHLCDTVKDCPDNEDEEDCDSSICEKDEFRCQNGRCIPTTSMCDGQLDCLDHSDEVNCTQTCPKDQYRCTEGLCIPARWRCNGIEDCSSGDDEADCDCEELWTVSCGGGTCARRCDGVAECPESQDETDCVRRAEDGHLMLWNTGEWLPVCAAGWSDSWSRLACLSLGYSEVEAANQVDLAHSANRSLVANSSALPSPVRLVGSLQLSEKMCPSKKGIHLVCGRSECGSWSPSFESRQSLDTRQGRLLGGDVAHPGLWPSLVTLSPPNSTAESDSCIASILSPKWVLTSWDCLRQLDKELAPGRWMVNAEEGRRISVTRIVAHPNAKVLQNIVYYDAALAMTSEPLATPKDAACLPSRAPDPSSLCVTAGWGPSSEGFHSLPVPILTYCNSTRYYNGLLTPALLCAGYLDGNRTACREDVGAPLMCINEEHQWELHGVLTSQPECSDRTRRPSLYTNVVALRSWVQSVLLGA